MKSNLHYLVWMAQLIGVFFSGAVCGSAQQDEVAKYEVFGGYTYLRAHHVPERISLNGWSASVERYLNRRVALAADFDGAYGSDGGERITAHSALFGSKFVGHRKRFASFAHTLAGVVRESQGARVEYGFGMHLGGGLDYELNRRIALRPAQAGYEYGRVDGVNQHSFHFVAGVVVKFGQLK